MPPKATSIEDDLRNAIAKSGKTPYVVAKEAEVDQSVLSRFLNSKRGITLETASKLATYLGLRLR